MPHIHTEPGQCDMTVSGYVVREIDGEWHCLVHMHRKIDMLMQIGGHIDLDQTPWQAIAAELAEETGYQLAELKIFQPVKGKPDVTDAIVHPLPFLQNTHDVGNGHYHSDLCYGFVAQSLPAAAQKKEESQDLRWLTLSEMCDLAAKGIALAATTDIYDFLLTIIPKYKALKASSFSLDKPIKGITYKR